MSNFQIKIESEKEHLTSLEFNSKSITSIIGNNDIKVKTKGYTNSNGEDVIEIFRIKDGVETLIGTYIYNYGKDI